MTYFVVKRLGMSSSPVLFSCSLHIKRLRSIISLALDRLGFTYTDRGCRYMRKLQTQDISERLVYDLTTLRQLIEMSTIVCMAYGFKVTAFEVGL